MVFGMYEINCNGQRTVTCINNFDIWAFHACAGMYSPANDNQINMVAYDFRFDGESIFSVLLNRNECESVAQRAAIRSAVSATYGVPAHYLEMIEVKK